MRNILILISLLIIQLMIGCSSENKIPKGNDLGADEILGNSEFPAFSYGGYRAQTRDTVPSVERLMEDMKILSAMGIKVLRTYNTQQYSHASNLLKAIRRLKDTDSSFEMYVMLGTWIECEGAWSTEANHEAGNMDNNKAEIETAVKLANTYPDIVKVIAVGNEAMVQWAINYFVYPKVILKWVDHLRDLRDQGKIPAGIWITSSDNYESWGGGAKNYQTDDLADLIRAVDFISLHTYPFHDSHYNPTFWGVPEEEENLTEIRQIDAAMLRAKKYAISQYQQVVDYTEKLGIEKPIHIGETGWATVAGSSYGDTGSRAADEYKEKLYYEHMRDWTQKEGISCFYFEAFDERWKDPGNTLGSENHFGLINLNGEAKYALWEMVDQGVFEGLTRDGQRIVKSYQGDLKQLMRDVLPPPLQSEMSLLQIQTINSERKVGHRVTEDTLIIVHESLTPMKNNKMSYPSSVLKLNPWEGTCGIEMSRDKVIKIVSGTGGWWGCALEAEGGAGENLSLFKSGRLNFDISGNSTSYFELGFQTGSFAQGTQTNNYIRFGPEMPHQISGDWTSYSIPLNDLDQGANLENVTALIYLRGSREFDGKNILLKNIYFSKND